MTQGNRQNGAAIRRAREARGLKPGKFAAQIDIAHSTLRGVENGHDQPSWETLNRIANGLDVPLNELLSDAGRDEHRKRERAAA